MRLIGLAVVLALAIALAPIAAEAQQTGQIQRIGVPMGLGEDDPRGQARVAAFREGCRRSGGRRAATSASTSAGRRRPTRR